MSTDSCFWKEKDRIFRMNLAGENDAVGMAAGGESLGVMDVLSEFQEVNKRLSRASDLRNRLFERLDQLERGQNAQEQLIGDLRAVHGEPHESNLQVESVNHLQWESNELEAIVASSLRLRNEVECLTAQRDTLTAEFDEVCKDVDPHVLETDTVWDRLQTEHKIMEFWVSKVTSDVLDLARKLEEYGVEVENQEWEAAQSQSMSQSEESTIETCSDEVVSPTRKSSGLQSGEDGDQELPEAGGVELLRVDQREVDGVKTEEIVEKSMELHQEDLAPNHTNFFAGRRAQCEG